MSNRKTFDVAFEWGEDEEYGNEGWKPMQEGFNVVSDFGMAHDILEHSPSDTGTLADEIRAFGAMLFIRGESYWWANQRAGRGFADNAADEIYEFMKKLERRELELDTPPVTKPITYSHFPEEELAETLAQIKKCALSDKEFSDDWLTQAQVTHYFKIFKHWMRIGYRNAIKRFGTDNADEVAWLFTEVMNEAKRYLNGDYGQTLKVKVWPKEFKFTMKVVEPDYDY